MLVTGLIVAYGYLTEIFMAWYSGNEYEQYMTVNRMAGKYAWSFWMLILCNVIIPQSMWFKQIRQSVVWMFIISIIVNIGMWLERFVIIVTSLSADFMPSAWHMYTPTFWDFSTYFGSIGLFLCMFLLFIRFLPVISIFEMRELVHEKSEDPDSAAPAQVAEMT
jgi:molybdopterin-containing oxidoreductase family membrane subunit